MRIFIKSFFHLNFVVALLFPLSTKAFEGGSEKIQLTIYNNNYTLVRDYRIVNLNGGENKLRFKEICRDLMPSSFFARLLSAAPGIYILEQFYDLETVTYGKLLEQAVGHKIRYKTYKYNHSKPAGNEEGIFDIQEGTLLARDENDGMIVEEKGSIRGKMYDPILFEPNTERLSGIPTLHLNIVSPVAAQFMIELSYLTSNINWTASYTAEVNEIDDTVDFRGVATLKNNTELNFKKAQVLLIATSHHRPTEEEGVKSPKTDTHEVPKKITSLGKNKFMAADLRGKNYPLSQPVDLNAKQEKSIPLVQACNIKGERQFWVIVQTPYEKDSNAAMQAVPVTSMISITNNQREGLGLPLPAGELLVYHKISNGFSIVSDQTYLNPITEEGKIPMRLGDAEGLQASFQQTDYKKLGPHSIEVGYCIIIKNQRRKSVIVRLLKELHHSDVTVLRETHPHKQDNGLLWVVEVPGQDNVELRYRLRIALPEEG